MYRLPDGLELFDTRTVAGRGVRATRRLDYREGDDEANCLGLYRGELLSRDQIDLRYGPSGDAVYAIRVGEEDWYIDAVSGGPDSWARVINDPGVPGGENVEFVADTDAKEVWVVLKRTVGEGEQLLAEYNPHQLPASAGGYSFGGTHLPLGETDRSDTL